MTMIIEIRTDPENRMSIDTGTVPVSRLDRAALRIGLLLILWGRRNHAPVDPRELHRLQEMRRAAEAEHQRAVARASFYRPF